MRFCRAADFDDRPIDDVDAANRAFLGRRMDVEHDRVAGRDHRDRVVDDRRGGIRRGRDRADDAERGPLEERQAAVAGFAFGLQHFGAGRFVGDEPVLDDLVFVAAEAGLAMGGEGQRFAFAERRLADAGDDLVALGERQLVESFEGRLGCFDGRIQVAESAEPLLAAAARTCRGCRRRRCRREIRRRTCWAIASTC